jgi:4-hydroxyphenylacetate 3-monooxygenase
MARADFTLGLALALSDVLGLKSNARINDQLIDLVIDAQTIRSCITALEMEWDVTRAGHVQPRGVHLATASIYAIRARQRMSEILRDMPGSALVVAPTDRDFEDPEMAAGLERAFGGGEYTAKERAALLQLAWDHVSSGLDGRESTFELHANGGLPTWRNRIQRWFDRYDELGNGVLKALSIDLKRVSVDHLRQAGRPLASAPKTPEPADAAPRGH